MVYDITWCPLSKRFGGSLRTTWPYELILIRHLNEGLHLNERLVIAIGAVGALAAGIAANVVILVTYELLCIIANSHGHILNCNEITIAVWIIVVLTCAIVFVPYCWCARYPYGWAEQPPSTPPRSHCIPASWSTAKIQCPRKSCVSLGWVGWRRASICSSRLPSFHIW